MVMINPYLNFPGNAEEAFNFYKSVFGGEFAMVQRFKDTTAPGELSAEDGEKMMHIALPLGNNNVLMASDVLESKGDKFIEGNNIYLSINTDSKEEADKLFNGLSAGGQVELPMADMFWGDYFGMLFDKFGIKWMISFHKK
ncbi:MAG: VOC family protein [Bacteroidota bacterium]